MRDSADPFDDGPGVHVGSDGKVHNTYSLVHTHTHTLTHPHTLTHTHSPTHSLTHTQSAATFACDICRVLLCKHCFWNGYDHRSRGKVCDFVTLLQVWIMWWYIDCIVYNILYIHTYLFIIYYINLINHVFWCMTTYFHVCHAFTPSKIMSHIFCKICIFYMEQRICSCTCNIHITYIL